MSAKKKIKELLTGKKEKRSFAAWMFFIGIVLATGSAYLVYTTPLFTPKAEDMLPSTDLLVFADIGDPDCPKNIAQNTENICGERSRLLELFFGAFPERLASFSDSLAIAIYSEPLNAEQKSSLIMLLRIHDSRAAEEFILSQSNIEQAEEGIQNGVKYFSLPQKTFIIWRGWLIITPDISFISKLLAVKNDESPSLSENSDYAHLRSMDSSSFSRIFIEKKASALLPEPWQGFATFFGDFFPEVLISFSTDQKGATINISAKPKAKMIPPEKRNNDLLPIFSILPQKETAFILGFSQAANEFLRVIKMIEEVDLSYSLFLQGRIQSILTGYFDTEISLEYDILPLLEDESVFALIQKEQRYFPIILATVNDKEFAAAKQEKMRNALSNVAAGFVPRVLTHRLEDGTEITEVSGCDDCVQMRTENLNNGELTSFSATNEKEESKAISLGMSDDMFAVSPDVDIVKGVVENMETEKERLPDIVTEIENIPQQKEVLVFSPKILEFYDLPFWEYGTDFSKVIILHSETEKGWTLSIEGSYSGE